MICKTKLRKLQILVRKLSDLNTRDITSVDAIMRDTILDKIRLATADIEGYCLNKTYINKPKEDE